MEYTFYNKFIYSVVQMCMLFSICRFDSWQKEIFLEGVSFLADNRPSSLYPDTSQRCVVCVFTSLQAT